MPDRSRTPLLERVTQRLPVRELPLILALVVMVIWFASSSEFFLTESNMLNLSRAFFVELAFLTIAEALVLLLRGIDLSVAATLALAAVMLGWLTQEQGVNIWVAVVLVLLLGVAAGAVNGCLIVYVRLSPIVATLTTLTLYRGLAYGISRGESYSGFPPSFTQLGTGTIAGIPTQLIILLGVLVIAMLVLHRSIVGRWVYAIGGNADAARFAGLPVNKVTIGVYAASGLLAAAGGVIAAARFGTARSDLYTGGELDAITAAILGGIAISGGVGYLLAAVAGALAIAVLRNGMTLVGESGFVQVVVIGFLLIAAVLIDRGFRHLQDRRRSREQLRALVATHEDDPESTREAAAAPS